MWDTVINIQHILQKVFPNLRLVYDDSTQLFVATPPTFRHTLLVSFVLLVEFVTWLFTTVHIVTYLKTSQPSDENFVERFMCFFMDFHMWIMYMLTISSVITFLCHGQAIAWTFNQLADLGKKRESIHRESVLSEKLLIYGIESIIIGTAVSNTCSPWIYSDSGEKFLIQTVLNPFNLSNTTVSAIASIRTTVQTLVAFPMVSHLIIMACLALNETRFVFKPGYLIRPEFLLFYPFDHAIETHSKSFLIYSTFNKVFQLSGPILFLTAFVINLSTSVACLKLHSTLPLPVVGAVFTENVGTLCISVILLGQVSIISDEFQKFWRFWKDKVRNKRQELALRACHPIAIRLGTFGYIQRATSLLYFDELVVNIVNLLLAC